MFADTITKGLTGIGLLIIVFLLFEILSLLFGINIDGFLFRKFYNDNPNRCLYDLLQNYDAELSFLNFLAYFADYFRPDSKRYFDPLKEKQKTICFNAFRFAIGLVTINTFNKEKSLDIIQEILCMLAIDKENSPNENFYEKENIIINNYHLLKATHDDNDVLEYVFLNKNSNELLTISIDISNCDTCDEDEDVYDTTDILTEKFRFLVD